MTCTQYGSGFVANESHVDMFSRFYRADGTTIGVLAGHGAGGLSNVWLAGSVFPLVKPIADRYPVVAGDFGGAYSWGNDTAIDAVASGKTRLQGALGAKAGKVLLYGISMGGAVVLNWARQHLDDVAGILLIKPAVGIEDIRANNRDGLAAGIEAAYGGNAGWQAAKPTHNPVQYAAELDGIPIHIWYAEDDETTIPGRVLAFAADAGDSCVVTSLGPGTTHTQGWPGDEEQLEFLASVA